MKNSKPLTKQQCHTIAKEGLLRLTVPGKGFILLDENDCQNNKRIEQEIDSYFISGIIYPLKNIHERKYISDQQISLGVNFSVRNIQTGSLIEIWEQQYAKCCAEAQVKIVRIQAYQIMLTQQLASFLMLLQKAGMWVIISIKLENTVKQYQKELFNLIKLITTFKPSLYISGISIELQTFNQNPLQTLAIWKRVIPPTIGSIIINKFQHKNVFNLFMQGKVNPFNLQFISSETSNVEQKALECLGVQ